MRSGRASQADPSNRVLIVEFTPKSDTVSFVRASSGFGSARCDVGFNSGTSGTVSRRN